jgi:transposase
LDHRFAANHRYGAAATARATGRPQYSPPTVPHFHGNRPPWPPASAAGARDGFVGRLRQNRIENKLAKRHLQNGSLVLFDVSSTAYTGSKSSLRQHGHSRDHRSDLPQIVYGLLCDRHGRPVSVEVLPGNTADPKAFSSLVQRMRKRFGISSVVFVGDRGMITSKRIDEDLRGVDGLHWITALRSEAIRALAKAGHVSRSLFDEKNLFEVRDDELFPGERLIVCRNPSLADERARKRVELLEATERELLKIVKATQRSRNPLSGEANIALRVGKVISAPQDGEAL